MGKPQIVKSINQIWKNNKETIQRGLEEILDPKEITKLLVEILFETQSVKIRDFDRIEEEGAFTYTASIKEMVEEGLIGRNLIKTEKAFGPCYVDFKKINICPEILGFFSKQDGLRIKKYLEENPLSKPGDYIVLVRMETGGMDWGYETRRQLTPYISHKIWSFVPYFRKEKKVIDAGEEEKLENFIEGPMPSPEDTSCIIIMEELINFGKTTSNATKFLRNYGYNSDNEIKIIAACELHYKNPIGVERLTKLGVDVLYLTTGRLFFQVAKEQGYITKNEYRTVEDWLNDPIDFMRRLQ